MSKKILIITAIVIVIIGLGATAVYITQRQEGKEVKKLEEVATIPEESLVQPKKPVTQPEEPTITEPIDTSNWKVYKNDALHIEFSYPPEWELEHCINFPKNGKAGFHKPECNFWVDIGNATSLDFRWFELPLVKYICDEHSGLYFYTSQYRYGTYLLNCNEIKVTGTREAALTDASFCDQRRISESGIPGGSSFYLENCKFLTILYSYSDNEKYPIFIAGKRWGEECFKEYCDPEKFVNFLGDPLEGEFLEKAVSKCTRRYLDLCKERNKRELQNFNEFIKTIHIWASEQKR